MKLYSMGFAQKFSNFASSTLSIRISMSDKWEYKRTAREFVIQFLYGPQFPHGNEDLLDPKSALGRLDEFVESYSLPDHENPHPELTEQVKFLARKWIQEILGSLDSLRDTITPRLKGTSWSNVKKIERTILLMSVHELLTDKELAPNIIINEAVELAKKYGSAESHSFVNGVLDAIKREERSSN